VRRCGGGREKIYRLENMRRDPSWPEKAASLKGEVLPGGKTRAQSGAGPAAKEKEALARGLKRSSVILLRKLVEKGKTHNKQGGGATKHRGGHRPPPKRGSFREKSAQKSGEGGKRKKLLCGALSIGA